MKYKSRGSGTLRGHKGQDVNDSAVDSMNTQLQRKGVEGRQRKEGRKMASMLTFLLHKYQHTAECPVG